MGAGAGWGFRVTAGAGAEEEGWLPQAGLGREGVHVRPVPSFVTCLLSRLVSDPPSGRLPGGDHPCCTAAE